VGGGFVFIYSSDDEGNEVDEQEVSDSEIHFCERLKVKIRCFVILSVSAKDITESLITVILFPRKVGVRVTIKIASLRSQ